MNHCENILAIAAFESNVGKPTVELHVSSVK